ncbi:transcriptional regulator [Nocardia terpenica]|uniref:HTH cro/C1-type domain-containing protein n=1 Tax=Nocardia terpenica TaxID=455432 RepID=A0A164NG34_9NOCA|nr:hypothetical protein [Nocardia terpenica]KZM74326.1 hypothetical protein AWN90_24855 [Nocardia terpenica]MBF6059976.1 transcriptional regulator [Nocardia terpenica]MBF6102483.1 transcriptional regulator [Nocardia terpenica]MBF6111326.1 transcriptional regulator [Nocardia terpenica]MBF6117457.1 transcriptional regulator [Nocardia terpenica]
MSHDALARTIDDDTFASRLNRLFDTAGLPGIQLRTKEVGRALRANGLPISDLYLLQLRTGTRTDPSPATVSALARYFGVAPEYFPAIEPDPITDSKNIDRHTVTLLGCAELQRLLLAACDLSGAAQELLAAMAADLHNFEYARTAEVAPV